jgi:hypothetical protein
VMDDLMESHKHLIKNVNSIFIGDESSESFLKGNVYVFCLWLDKYDCDDNYSYGIEYPISSDTKQEIIQECLSKRYACVGEKAISQEICEKDCGNRFICYTNRIDRGSKLDFILKTIKDGIRGWEDGVIYSERIDRTTDEYKDRIQTKKKKLFQKLGIKELKGAGQ